MRDSLKHWLGLHHASTYMILGALVVAALSANPTSIAYVMIIGVLGPFLFLMREVAHAEGGGNFRVSRFVASSLVIVAAFFIMSRIHWVAI
jgi:hypothetical protein